MHNSGSPDDTLIKSSLVAFGNLLKYLNCRKMVKNSLIYQGAKKVNFNWEIKRDLPVS